MSKRRDQKDTMRIVIIVISVIVVLSMILTAIASAMMMY